MTSVTHKYYLYLTREVISHIGCRNAKSATIFTTLKSLFPWEISPGIAQIQQVVPATLAQAPKASSWA